MMPTTLAVLFFVPLPPGMFAERLENVENTSFICSLSCKACSECESCLGWDSCAWVTNGETLLDGRLPEKFDSRLGTPTRFVENAGDAAAKSIRTGGHCVDNNEDAFKAFQNHYTAVLKGVGDPQPGEDRLVDPKVEESFGITRPTVCNKMRWKIDDDLKRHPFLREAKRGGLTKTTLEEAAKKCKANSKDAFFQKNYIIDTSSLVNVILDAPFDDKHEAGKSDAEITSELSRIDPFEWGRHRGSLDPIQMVIAASEFNNFFAIYIHSGRHRAVAAWGSSEIPVNFECHLDEKSPPLTFQDKAGLVVKNCPSSSQWIPFTFARDTIREKNLTERTRAACIQKKICS